jgi:hypothetical protein
MAAGGENADGPVADLATGRPPSSVPASAGPAHAGGTSSVRRYRSMRAVDCPCGEHVEGTNDSEVLAALKRHNDDDHKDQYNDTDLRLMVDTGAYDAGS